MTIVFQEEIEKRHLCQTFGAGQKTSVFLHVFSEMEIFILPMTSTQEITLLSYYYYFFLNKPVSYEHLCFHHYTDCVG